MSINDHLGALSSIAALLLLGGCATLLGDDGERDAFFRFGVAEEIVKDRPQGPAALRPLTLERIRFAPEIEGDRILAIRGASVLYIKDARWAAPAPELFAQAVLRQFRQRAPNIAVVQWQTGGAGTISLQLNIDRFEARYALGSEEAVPLILMSGDAVLTRRGTLEPIVSQRFMEEEPATQNSRAAIAAAFDRAAVRFAATVADWTSQSLQN